MKGGCDAPRRKQQPPAKSSRSGVKGLPCLGGGRSCCFRHVPQWWRAWSKAMWRGWQYWPLICYLGHCRYGSPRRRGASRKASSWTPPSRFPRGVVLRQSELPMMSARMALHRVRVIAHGRCCRLFMAGLLFGRRARGRRRYAAGRLVPCGVLRAVGLLWHRFRELTEELSFWLPHGREYRFRWMGVGNIDRPKRASVRSLINRRCVCRVTGGYHVRSFFRAVRNQGEPSG